MTRKKRRLVLIGSALTVLAVAVALVLTALKDAGSTSDPRPVRDALERIRKLDTPLGMFSFDDARDAAYPPSVQIVRHGRFQLL